MLSSLFFRNSPPPRHSFSFSERSNYVVFSPYVKPKSASVDMNSRFACRTGSSMRHTTHQNWDTVIRSPSWSGKNKTATCENGIENEPSKVSTRTASGKWNPGPDGGSPDGPPVHFGTVKATLILLQHRNHRRH